MREHAEIPVEALCFGVMGSIVRQVGHGIGKVLRRQIPISRDLGILAMSPVDGEASPE
jgi:hypothetical protein